MSGPVSRPTRVVITGATGNLGTGLLRRLQAEAEPPSVVGVVRRPPEVAGPPYDTVEWRTCDVGAMGAVDVLADAMNGADAVVHLAWQIQPSHNRVRMLRTNVTGSRQVFAAAVQAGVPHLVHLSSVGAYSPGPKDRYVDESWPTGGVASSMYSQHKATVERMLDRLERDNRAVTITRVRPGLVFQADAASEIARYFLGPLMPSSLLRLPIKVLPMSLELVCQAVHAHDVGDALVRVLRERPGGAFNLAAEPVIYPRDIAAVLGARLVTVPFGLLRALASLSWRARLQPVDAGWLDLGRAAPLMDSGRARRELDWSPEHTAIDALRELLSGMAEGQGTDTPAMTPRHRLWSRLGEFLPG
ncbi:NAD-dependent epimerase/dehydratase family protein [soil metagenome]